MQLGTEKFIKVVMPKAIGKKISTSWRNDAPASLESLWAEIELRFGVCPSFFKLAKHEPPICRNLFHLAEFAYLDNPDTRSIQGEAPGMALAILRSALLRGAPLRVPAGTW